MSFGYMRFLSCVYCGQKTYFSFFDLSKAWTRANLIARIFECEFSYCVYLKNMLDTHEVAHAGWDRGAMETDIYQPRAKQ